MGGRGVSILPRRGRGGLVDLGAVKFRIVLDASVCIPSPRWGGIEIELIYFHGFRVGGLRPAAAPPVATILGPFGAEFITHGVFEAGFSQLLRPNGATVCSHGWSGVRRKANAAQPVDVGDVRSCPEGAEGFPSNSGR